MGILITTCAMIEANAEGELVSAYQDHFAEIGQIIIHVYALVHPGPLLEQGVTCASEP